VRPTKAQKKMLENVKSGRVAHCGFNGGESASYVLGAVLEAGWLVHSMQPTGPAFVLTEAGKREVP
jgi:hypothetical protein